MWNYLFIGIFATIFYKYFLRGIYFIFYMKFKYAKRINCFYFPFLGGLVKDVIYPEIIYRNSHRNLVLERRQNPKLEATVAGGGLYNVMLIYDPELIKDIL